MALTKIKGAGINISATEKLYFDGGGNTYIHESAADVLKLVVGGVAFMDATEGTNAIVFNEGSVDMDFRVESNGSANMLFVDGGNEEVLIQRAASGGTATAGSVLIVEDDDNAEISLLGGSSSLLAINFGHSGDVDDGMITYNTTSGSEAMQFTTNAAIRATIDKDGKTGFNTTVMDAFVNINSGADNSGLHVESTDGHANLSLADNAGSVVLVGSGADFMVETGGSASTAGSSASEKFRIKSDGKVGIGTTSPSGKLHISETTTGKAMFIDHDANGISIHIDSEATTQAVLQIEADSLTQGAAAYFYSNCAEGSSRKLVHIKNDNDGSDDTIALFVHQDSNMQGMRMDCTESAYTDSMVFLNATTRQQSNAFNFLMGYTDGDDDVQHKLRGDGVTQNRTGTFESADYAEYFESKNGKAIAVGSTVKLDGDKVVACEDGDKPIGVIRPLNTSLVGNSAWANWGSKYLTDDYGSPIMEEYTSTKWIDGKNEDGSNNDIEYQTDKIPSDVTVPNDAIVISTEKDGSKLMRKKLNPAYDKSKIYVERENRDEWNIVGLLGQIPIAKGQPMASSWIKMKDISDTVEMWMVK